MKGWVETMKQLLKLEFRRLTRLKSLYICGSIMLAMVLLSASLTNSLNNWIDGIAGYIGGSGMEGLLGAVETSRFELLIAIFVALSVCEDFEQKTVRVILSRGFTRKQVYFSKLIGVLAMASAVYGVVLLTAFAINTMYFGAGSVDAGELLGVLFFQYIACLAEVTMFFSISYMLRKNGAAIAINIVAPIVLPAILTLRDVTAGLGATKLSEWWISGIIGDLSSMGISSGRMAECLIGSLIYMIGFGALGLLCAEKTEV